MLFGVVVAPRRIEPVVARKVNREVVVLLGWTPAVLLQLAHPLVAAGVAEHSSFREAHGTRVRRLRSTLNAMLALTFGSPEEVWRAADGINRIHDRVNGRLAVPRGVFPAGTAYSAHDPALLTWVHATLLDVLPRTYELYVGPLGPGERDRYCLEGTGLGPLLGVPEGGLPASVPELRAYMARMLSGGEIAVTPPARELARALLHPPAPPGAEALLWLGRLPTVGLLPPAVRRAYGFAWGPRHAAGLRLTAALARRALPLVPPMLRQWPAARCGAADVASRRTLQKPGLLRCGRILQGRIAT
jgi:uncharacterized protein (DUF2236 family)